MTGFAVIRHPDAGVGVAPAAALPIHLANGWVRVSEFRAEPSAFHLPDFVDAPDVDAKPAPKPVSATPANTKESKA